MHSTGILEYEVGPNAVAFELVGSKKNVVPRKKKGQELLTDSPKRKYIHNDLTEEMTSSLKVTNECDEIVFESVHLEAASPEKGLDSRPTSTQDYVEKPKREKFKKVEKKPNSLEGFTNPNSWDPNFFIGSRKMASRNRMIPITDTSTSFVTDEAVYYDEDTGYILSEQEVQEMERERDQESDVFLTETSFSQSSSRTPKSLRKRFYHNVRVSKMMDEAFRMRQSSDNSQYWRTVTKNQGFNLCITPSQETNNLPFLSHTRTRSIQPQREMNGIPPLKETIYERDTLNEFFNATKFAAKEEFVSSNFVDNSVAKTHAKMLLEDVLLKTET
ncbi:hypothetical protein PCE1_002629 [Barthelona sp. PCE]